MIVVGTDPSGSRDEVRPLQGRGTDLLLAFCLVGAFVFFKLSDVL